MPKRGWPQLVEGCRRFCRPGQFPIAAYSEFMPPPRVGRKPYGSDDPVLFTPDDPLGWHVTEHEEAVELRPGLLQVAREVLTALEHLGQGRPALGIARAKLDGNPYWPPELAARAGKLPQERYVTLAPLALSRTQDDKGRVRWTLFGSSEQGPEFGFWKSFFTGPGCEWPADRATDLIRRLLHKAYRRPLEELADLRKAGFRILPTTAATSPLWPPVELPAWTAPYLLRAGEPLAAAKYLLCFQPFGSLPGAIRAAYLDGRLHLLPFPGSLVFWGAGPLLRLREALPTAMQIGLLHLCERHAAATGLRVPQSGWLHEPHPDQPLPDPAHGIIRNTYRRTHRWERIHRHEDPLGVADGEDRLAHVLFSAAPDDVGLYGKPMARNAQIWTHEYALLLDGPRASRAALARAARALAAGGHFGYRFFFPPMHVGRHAVYWHRPLVAYRSPETGQAEVIGEELLGCLTAYAGKSLERPVELWPRLLEREGYGAVIGGFQRHFEHPQRRAACNVRKLLDARRLLERPLPRSFARQLLTAAKDEGLEQWLEMLPKSVQPRKTARLLVEQIRGVLEPDEMYPAHSVCGDSGTSSVARPERAWQAPDQPRPFRACHPNGTRSMPDTLPLTLWRTARRSFEVAYWKTIAGLSAGEFVTKENGDCARDPITQTLLGRQHRDLDALGDYLLGYYRRLIAERGMARRAMAGEFAFPWRTDFDFPWLGGWADGQRRDARERDLVVVIPGRDRGRAVIMADHYDTAYMEDTFDRSKHGSGARLAAAGADDNASATAALMLAAPLFFDMSRAGALGCDVWLVHLTGEEFPADCLGARHLAQAIVERTLQLRVAGRRPLDLSRVEIQGVYVLDMIAHNRDNDHDVFQISPGTGRESLWLAYQAHLANMAWNANAPRWNERSRGRRCRRGERSADPRRVPEIALHPTLYGEVRPPSDPRSSLFNTDGQIFSDAGIPVVLFMEDYDINRRGYHDTHDTMANIDLDYGSALAAIAIEAVARAAREK